MLVQLHDVRMGNRRERAQLVLRVLPRVATQAHDLERDLLPRLLVLGGEDTTESALAQESAQHAMPAHGLPAVRQLRHERALVVGAAFRRLARGPGLHGARTNGPRAEPSPELYFSHDRDLVDRPQGIK